MSQPSRRAHVAPRELALYVIDALDAALKDAVEAHVMGCAACAEALAREARLDMELLEVAAASPGPLVSTTPWRRHGRAVVDRASRRTAGGHRWGHRAMGGVAGALAAAAAIVLVMATTSTRSDAGEPIRGASLDAAQQSASADSAQQALSAGVLEGDRPTDALDGG